VAGLPGGGIRCGVDQNVGAGPCPKRFFSPVNISGGSHAGGFRVGIVVDRGSCPHRRVKGSSRQYCSVLGQGCKSVPRSGEIE